MMEAAGVTEELKARDPMRWAGLMNTLKAQVKEVIRLEKAKPMERFQTNQSSRNHLDCGKLKPCEILFRKFLRA